MTTYKPIKNYENYSISDTGLVVNEKFNRQIKQTLSNVGYLYVELWKSGVGRKFSTHRLVAEAFIPNPNNKECVHHKDSDRRNNNVDNLEWVSVKENTEHKLSKASKGSITKKKIMKLYKSQDWKSTEEFLIEIIKF